MRRCAAKSTPTDPVTVVDTETERLLRDRLAELRPGDPVLGEEERRCRSRVEPGAAAVGARPDRRHGELRLRHRGVRGVGRRADRRRVGGGCCRRTWPRARCTRLRWVTAPASDAPVRPRRCAARPSGSCRWLWWAPDSATAPERRARQAAVLARLLPDVRDMRRIGSCALDLCMVAAGQLDALLRGRCPRLGLGRRRADRRGGGRNDGSARRRR